MVVVDVADVEMDVPGVGGIARIRRGRPVPITWRIREHRGIDGRGAAAPVHQAAEFLHIG